MREVFRQYFRLTDAEIVQLWEKGLFCFDASALLNVYGYSAEAREELVAFFEKYAERIRLPHQFGLEFCRNRRQVIVKQVSNYTAVETELKRIHAEHIETKRDHPYLSIEARNAYNGILEELEESRHAMEQLIRSDPYCGRILDVFEGRVGPEPTPEDLVRLHDEAKRRYDKRIPPGYADLKKKGVPQAYGDYIGWAQLMEIAQGEKRGVIFVTDDFKGDWWYIEGTRTLGPNPELVKEFTHDCNELILFYNSESFLRAAKKLGAAEIRDFVIEEVTQRIESQRQSDAPEGLKSVPSGTNIEDKQAPTREAEEKPIESLKPVVPPTPATGPNKLPSGGE